MIGAGKRVVAKEQPRAKADMAKVTTVAGAAAAIDAALIGRSTTENTPKGTIKSSFAETLAGVNLISFNCRTDHGRLQENRY